jgi:hypothetical protein
MICETEINRTYHKIYVKKRLKKHNVFHYLNLGHITLPVRFMITILSFG